MTQNPNAVFMPRPINRKWRAMQAEAKAKAEAVAAARDAAMKAQNATTGTVTASESADGSSIEGEAHDELT
jgi:hypothetical protein